MRRSEKGTKGVDGYIGNYAVQVKFKWVTDRNFSDRYITVKSDAEFDILIVCVNGGDDEVLLFGAWEKRQVEKARTMSKPHDQVKLQDLDKLDRLQIKKSEPGNTCFLIQEKTCRTRLQTWPVDLD